MLKVLWTGEYDKNWDEKFSSEFEVTKASSCIGASVHDGLLNEDQLIEALKGKDIFIAGYDRVTEKVLKNSPDLKLILSVRDGPEDSVDIAACSAAGVPVISAGGRCVHSVAETTLMLMFALTTNLIELAGCTRKGEWGKPREQALTFDKGELFQKTLAIIGLGRNGKQLSILANGIGMKVVAYDPYVSKEVADSLNVTLLPLEECMKQGDFVSLLARVTPETTNMIKKEHIAMMKPTAYLINTGRPKLCDENLIFDAIENGTIKGAAIDVFSPEPIPADHRAYTIPSDKLIITPHIAGMSKERVPHQYENLYASYNKFLKGDLSDVPLYNRAVLDSPLFKEHGGKLFGSEK